MSGRCTPSILEGALVLAAGHIATVVAVSSYDGSVLALAPGLLLVGAGMGLCLAPITTLVLSNVDPQRAGDQIRTRPEPNCSACGAEGLLLYDGLEDRLFGAPGAWTMKRCPAQSCGLLWLDPAPLEEEDTLSGQKLS